MLAYMRYRHIPYRLMIGDQGDQEGRPLPQPKVSLLPTFYLRNSAGELEAVVDSTPLIRRFESMFTVCVESDKSSLPLGSYLFRFISVFSRF